ncbi:AMP-binding protein [Micromonospora profundi]|uniref:AMP-binding protein n=1 Tax=Micromonospora profundi TaxID=1420889 RepID=UPI0037F1BA3D
MTYPTAHALRWPDRPAVVIAETGETLTYGQLDDASRRLARAMWNAGLRPGDHVALMMANHLSFLEVYWAAMRSGLVLTPIGTSLTADEAAWIVDSCGARALVVDAAAPAAGALAAVPAMVLRLAVGGPLAGFDDYAETLAASSAEPLEHEPLGVAMVYSSGSTGRPKGVRRELSGRTVQEGHPHFLRWLRELWKFTDDSVFLTPAPLYHAAPLSFSSTVTAAGGTVVLMRRFDADAALTAIERYGITHALMVPTMFVRLLRLPAERRKAAVLDSLSVVIHGAGPCAVDVKRQMIDWLGPILLEYYAGSEDNGTTFIDSQEWLTHPGSVGRAIAGCRVHICGPEGDELPAGQDGLVYFEAEGGRSDFEYVGGADSSAARHPIRPDWSTLGDIGHLDDEGYLYLTDRRDYLIISGGVNISPQEIENAVIGYEPVVDVAVFGVPDEELGEQVVAVIQPVDPAADRDELVAGLLAYLAGRLARHKIPRSVFVVEALPRLPTGKLAKNRLRERYLPARALDTTAGPQEFRASVRALLERELPPGWSGLGALREDELHKWIARWRAVLARHRLLAPGWPVEHGGLGLAPDQQVVLQEEFARAGVPSGSGNDPFGIDMLGNTLLALGTPEQQAHYLPRILDGTDVWCQGFSEPGAGSDLAAVQTRAVLGADGRWRLTGQKIWTSNAHLASWIFVLARTGTRAERHRGLTFLLVPLDQPGVEVRPIRQLSGASHFNEVFFTDAVAADVVGAVGEGWAVAMALLGHERGQSATTQAIRYRAEWERLVRTAREHGMLERAWVRDGLAAAYVRIEVMDALGRRLAGGGLTGADAAGDAALFKLQWSAHHQAVTELALEILGPDATTPTGRVLELGYGGPDAAGAPISSASWVDIFYNARPGTIYAGTTQVLRNVVAERLLGMPKEVRPAGPG